MNSFVKFTIISSLFAASAFADESFGGIGVIYKLTSSGAEIQDIIPNTPVAETKIKIGDVIVAIDGSSVIGKKSREVRDVLRGLENKPVVLTYVSEGDTLVETIRRVKLTMKRLNNIANTGDSDKKLLAILNNGKVVERTVASVSNNFEGVYADEAMISAVNDERTQQAKVGTAKLASFSRSVIRVKLETAGMFVVSVVNSNGDVIRTFNENHGCAGINTIPWDGSLVPDGRYAISIEHNGNVSGVNILLK